MALAIALAVSVGGAVALPGTARAQASDATENFEVPAGALVEALRAFSQQTGLQMVYTADIVAGKSSGGVSGAMSRNEALARLLAGTGLTFRFSDNKTVIVESVSDGASGERVLGAVRVQGAQGGGLAGSTPANGINGSRDVTATENTGSYTSNALTVGSKVAATIKDTPMAVSVITNQQIQDRNVTDLNSAMRDAPGVTTLNSGPGFSYYSRGFAITQIQLDGGAPLALNGGGGVYTPIIDMSLYDHVELVRGATGTFNAYGDPGGVINLVRKRPLDHAQMLLEMQGGSWNWNRVSADITGPLGFGGKLRGRLIATHQGNDYFYKVSHLNRNVLSGTLEYDVTPTTLLSTGGNYQTESGNAWAFGLPRFYDGTSLGLPRSTSLTLPGLVNTASNLELYGQLDQQFGTRWQLTLKATLSSQRSDQSSAVVYAPTGVDPVTGGGLTIGRPQLLQGRNKQTLIEATLSGKILVFGHEQKVLVGANYSMGDDSGSGTYFDFDDDIYIGKSRVSGQYVAQISSFDPYSWIFGTGNYTKSSGVDFADTRSLNAYFSIDLNPVDNFHLSTSVRYSEYRRRSLAWTFCNKYQYEGGYCPTLGAKFYDMSGQIYRGHNVSWPPSVSGRYDVSRYLSIYATYSDIYKNRSNFLDVNKKPLPPTRGMNFEGGVKWLSESKKLNATLSVYYTKQKDIAQYRFCGSTSGASCFPAPNEIGTLNVIEKCCYVSDPKSYIKSYGLDIEVAGELRRGWQIAASYTFNRNEQRAPGLVDYDGSYKMLQSQSPKHLFKIWSTYDFAQSSPLAGLRVGLGANGQSMTFVSTARCTRYFTRADGSPDFCLDSVPVHFSDAGHIVADASIGYKIGDKLRIDAEFENLLDKVYYATIGDITQGNWYGAPRSFKVTLRGKF